MFNTIFLILSFIITNVICLFDHDLPKRYYFFILIYIGVYLAVLAVFFILLFIASQFIDKNKDYRKQSKVVHFFVYHTIELLNTLSGARIKVTGYDIVPANEKYICVFNHTSNFDPMVLTQVLKRDNLIHITKPGNCRIPICGPFILRDCYMPINRDNDREAIKTILKASEFLKNDMYCIGVSPEGTRNKGDESQLLPFKDGCFKTALRGHAGIVISELNGCNKIHKNFPFKRTKVEINFIKYLPYEEIKDLTTGQISEIVRTCLQEKIDSRDKK